MDNKSNPPSPDPSLPAMRKGFEEWVEAKWPGMTVDWSPDAHDLDREWSAYQHAWWKGRGE